MIKTLSRIYNESDVWFDSYTNLTVIAGKAPQGPTMTPVFVQNMSDYSKIKKIFGMNSDLLNGFYEACDDHTPICLIKLNGIHREININNCIFLKSVYSDVSINDVGIQVTDENIYFTVNGKSNLYNLKGQNVMELCNRINSDAILGLCPFIADYPFEKRDMLCTNLRYDILKQNGSDAFINGDTLSGIKKIKVEQSDGSTIEANAPIGVYADPTYDKRMDDRLIELFGLLEPMQITNINLLSIPFDYRFTNKYFIEELNIIKDESDNDLPYYELKFNDLKDFDINKFSYFGTKDYPLDIYARKIDTESGKTILLASVDFKEALSNIYDDYISQDGQYLYEYLSDYLNLKQKYLTPTFVNIGCTNFESIKEDVEIFMDNVPSLCKNPFINIIIDGYKTNIYDSAINNYFSNGVCFLSKAISNIEDFNNVTGYVNNRFYQFIDSVEDEDKYDLATKDKITFNNLGIITTNTNKIGEQQISNGSNLLIDQNIVLNTIGNANLILHILKNIDREVTLEQKNTEIKKTIQNIISNYNEAISSSSISVYENLQKNIINKTVTIELSIVGFFKSIKLSVEVV